MQLQALKQYYIYGLLLLALGFFVAYYYTIYSVLTIPIVLFIACLYFLSIDKVLILIAFCTPLSIKFLIGNSGINFPDEPLMLVLLLLFIIKVFENKQAFLPIFKQPLSLAIVFNLLWLFVTTLTSSLPIISIKFFLARLWCIVGVYFWGSLVFRNPKRIKQFLMAFALGLSIVVIYTFTRHWQNGFTQKSGTWVMTPFMDDHTVYSAVSSIVFTYSLIMLFYKKVKLSFTSHLVFSFTAMLALVGVVFSYSRAAVLSLIFVALFYLILQLKVSFKTLIIGLFLFLGICLIYHEEIYQHIRFNKSVSGKNVASDIKSISNVRTDESNVERLNRWESGYRMFKERPFFGFGPGTYVFKYSPYQRAHEMTSISTTKGTMGGIHSEYFGPLVESGVIGLISVLLLFGTYIYTLMKIYYQTINQQKRMYGLAILLAMLSYFFHGLLNNFLDQDKASVIFWAMMGMAAALNMQDENINGFLEKEL